MSGVSPYTCGIAYGCPLLVCLWNSQHFLLILMCGGNLHTIMFILYGDTLNKKINQQRKHCQTNKNNFRNAKEAM